jgi:AraC family transcriptional regulator
MMLAMSPYHFVHLFKRMVCVAPHRQVIQRRIERAKELLAKADPPTADIASP